MSTSRSSRSSSGGSAAAERESKWGGEGRSSKDDAKAQHSDLRGGMKAKLADSLDSAVEKAEPVAYSLRNRVVAAADRAAEKVEEVLDDDVAPHLRDVQRTLQQQTQDLRARESPNDAAADASPSFDEDEDIPSPVDDDEGEEGEQQKENSADWQSSLKSKGAQLITRATEVGGQLREKLRSAAPEVERQLARGVEKVRAMNRDGDQAASSGSEEDEEDDAEAEEEDDSTGRRSSDDLGSKMRSTARRVKEAVSEAHIPSRVQRAAGQLAEKASTTLDAAKQRARSVDWEGGAEALEESARGLQSRATRAATKVKSKAAQLMHRRSSDEADDEEAEGADSAEEEDIDAADDSEGVHVSLDEFDARGRASPSAAVLRDVDQQIAKAKRSRSGQLNWPLLVIGSLFTLWLAALIYNAAMPALAPARPPTLREQVRGFAHDASDRLEGKFDQLRHDTQPLADLLAGRRHEPTFLESIQWSLFGKPKQSQLQTAVEGIQDGIHSFEHGVYRVRDGLAHKLSAAEEKLHRASAYAKDHLIPNAQHAAHDSQAKFDHLRSDARHSAEKFAALTERQLIDLGIITPPTFAERVWNAINPFHHSETSLEKAQRMAAAGYDRATEFATDAKHRAQAGFEDVKDALHPHPRSLGDRIRSHLPGYEPTVGDRLRDGAESLQDLKDSAAAELRDIRSRTPSLDDIQFRSRDLAHEARDRVQAQMPQPQRSLGERFSDSIASLRAHLPGSAAVDSAASDLHSQAADLKERLSSQASELRDRAGAAWDLRTGLPVSDHSAPSTLSATHLEDRLRDAGHHLHEEAQHLRDRLSPSHAAPRQPGENLPGATHPMYNRESAPAVPISEVQSDMHRAAAPVDTHRETLTERVKHALSDVAGAVKSHLPSSRPQVQPTPTAASPLAGLHRAGEHLRDGAADGLRNLQAQARDGVHNVKASADSHLHGARKTAEYLKNRAVHGAEKLEHRAEETFDRVHDEVKFRLP